VLRALGTGLPARDRAGAADALRLIDRLRYGVPAWPAGVAAVRELLLDGDGPLYVERRPGALRRRARVALRELDVDLAAGTRLSPR
jgi:hypothetical protein